MICFDKVNLLFTCLIVLIRVNESMYSTVTEISIHSYGISRANSLDLCVSTNQHGLGSNAANYTRHYDKGFRRRITSTASATNTNSDDKVIATIPATTYPLVTSKVLQYSDVPNKNIIDRIFEYEEHEVRHRSKHRERLKDEQISNNLSVFKKTYTYRNSGFIGKKLLGKERIFLTENCSTVVAQIGTTATLHCEVSDITENTVTWIRKKDYSLLSVGLVTYSTDKRFFSAHGKHVKVVNNSVIQKMLKAQSMDWALHIRFASPADAGYYECQVPTHPPTSIFFKLVLVAAYAEIVGESEKIIHEGSMLRLICVVRRSTEPPSYVFWYFENRMINYDLNGVHVSNRRETSELVIARVELHHAGNYTCVPANAKPVSVTVHVIHNETPAAMQHDKSFARSTTLHPPLLFRASIMFCLIKMQ